MGHVDDSLLLHYIYLYPRSFSFSDLTLTRLYHCALDFLIGIGCKKYI